MTIEPHYTTYESLLDLYSAALKAGDRNAAHEAEVKLEVLEMSKEQRFASTACNHFAWGFQPKRIV